jgi:hypothetical protein
MVAPFWEHIVRQLPSSPSTVSTRALVQTPHRCDSADPQVIEPINGYRYNLRDKMLFAPEPLPAHPVSWQTSFVSNESALQE